MYLTETDRVNLMLMQNNNPTASDIIRDLIADDKLSTAKKNMTAGDEYYKINHDVLKHDFNEVIIDGTPVLNPLISNDKLVHAFHHILVNQKIDYVCGNPVKIQADESLLPSINEALGDKFDLLLKKWGINASNKGNEFLHPWIDKDGNFRLTIIPSQQIIEIYDQQYQEERLGVLRYYSIDVKRDRLSPKKTINKVELWDNEKTLFLIEEGGRYVLDPDQPENPKYNFYRYNTLTPSEKNGLSWGKIPFVKLKNNSLEMSDLQLCKSLIDNYDFSRSQFSNNLSDIQELFWILFGADKTDLGEFVRNLKTYKAMKVPQGADVQDKKGEIPFAARKEHEDTLWEDIFFFGMGVNWKSDIFRNPPSGAALKTLLIPLDLKANALIREWTPALSEVIYFLAKYFELTGKNNFDPKQIGFRFDKTMIINELEKSQIAQAGKGIISDETIIENHPWVKDAQLEMERLAKQSEEIINLDNVQA